MFDAWVRLIPVAPSPRDANRDFSLLSSSYSRVSHAKVSTSQHLSVGCYACSNSDRRLRKLDALSFRRQRKTSNGSVFNSASQQ